MHKYLLTRTGIWAKVLHATQIIGNLADAERGTEAQPGSPAMALSANHHLITGSEIYIPCCEQPACLR